MLYGILSASDWNYRVLPLPDPGQSCCTIGLDPSARPLGIPQSAFGLLLFLALDATILLSVSVPTYTGAYLAAGYCLSLAGLGGQVTLLILSLMRLRMLCLYCCLGTFLTCVAICFYAFLSGLGDSRLRQGPGRAFLAVSSAIFVVGSSMAAKAVTGSSSSVPIDVDAVQRMSQTELSPPDAHWELPPDANGTIIMFGDGQCPYCAEAFRLLYQAAKRPGGPRFVFRHFPLRSHVNALEDALGAELASKRGGFWLYESILYGLGPRGRAGDVLRSLGWSPAEIRNRLGRSYELQEAVSKDRVSGAKLGVRATPAIIEILGGRRYALTTRFLRQRFR